MKSKLHRKYVVQDGCNNCAKVCRINEWDEPQSLYCHRDKSERPLSGSVAMKEYFSRDYKARKPKKLRKGESLIDREYRLRDEYTRRQEKKWDAWSEPRRVEAWGGCPQHKREKE